MKSKEFKDLKTKKSGELLKMVSDKKVELTKITSKMYAGRGKNLKEGKMLRRDIAQILTVQNSKLKVKKEDDK